MGVVEVGGVFRLALRGSKHRYHVVRRYRIPSDYVVQTPLGLPFLPIRPGKGCHTSPILAPTIDVIFLFDLLPAMPRVCIVAEQMYVDPELLDELTKEQKEILFHKVSRDSVQSPSNVLQLSVIDLVIALLADPPLRFCFCRESDPGRTSSAVEGSSRR